MLMLDSLFQEKFLAEGAKVCSLYVAGFFDLP